MDDAAGRFLVIGYFAGIAGMLAFSAASVGAARTDAGWVTALYLVAGVALLPFSLALALDLRGLASAVRDEMRARAARRGSPGMSVRLLRLMMGGWSLLGLASLATGIDRLV